MDANSTYDRLEGGDDADKIDGMQGNDLLAGGGAGSEWKLVNSKWVFDPSKLKTPGKNDKMDESDDVILGGTGDDVLLGGARRR
jgi:serralysin